MFLFLQLKTTIYFFVTYTSLPRALMMMCDGCTVVKVQMGGKTFNIHANSAVDYEFEIL